MSDGNTQTNSFLVVFDNKLPKGDRVDILFKIREFPWWQETDYCRSERLNHVRIILRDAAFYQQAFDDVKKIDGVNVEPIAYMDTCSGKAPNIEYPSSKNCWDPRTWGK